LVERRADPKDRRVWRLRLTAAASPILQEMKCLRPKLHGAVTKGIDPSVLQAMAVGLNRIKENVNGRRLTEAHSLRTVEYVRKDGRVCPAQLSDAIRYRLDVGIVDNQ
jgi:hypothetical protein